MVTLKIYHSLQDLADGNPIHIVDNVKDFSGNVTGGWVIEYKVGSSDKSMMLPKDTILVLEE